jgi:hypothetical protein
MLIEEKFSAFVVGWSESYCRKLLGDVQGLNLVGCMKFLNFLHN